MERPKIRWTKFIFKDRNRFSIPNLQRFRRRKEVFIPTSVIIFNLEYEVIFQNKYIYYVLTWNTVGKKEVHNFISFEPF